MIFITGGVRSGKSAFAEQLAEQLAGMHYYYIATGTAFDQEMQARILRHQQDRERSGIMWKTVEMSTAFPQQVFCEGDVLLFECVTTWLGNVQYEAEQKDGSLMPYIENFKQQCMRWLEGGAAVIVVSNELLDEPASSYGEVNTYRQVLGELHQWLVAASHQAYEVDHKIVKQWK